jgi:hypothetical protein
MTDQRTRMAPPGTERWYDGDPKLPPKKIIKRMALHTSLWLTRVVVVNPGIQIDHQ